MKNTEHHEQRRVKVERRRQFYRSFEAQALKHRSFFTQISDDLTATFGSATFLVLNIVLFSIWITINSNLIPNIPAFDPFPFGLLTMFVSLEAIILAIILLVSQNRQAYISSIREELHLQINLIAEEEITKVLKLLAEMRHKMGIIEEDLELDEMLERLNTSYIERSLVHQMEEANSTWARKLVHKLNVDFPDLLNSKSPKDDHRTDKSTNNEE